MADGQQYDGYRSEKSRQLHSIILNYCFQTPTVEAAGQRLDSLERWLAAERENPDFILELPGENVGRLEESHKISHLMDVLRLPFGHPKDGFEYPGSPEAIRQLRIDKSQAMFRTLTDFIHKAIDAGKIDKQKYAEFLEQPNKRGFLLIHEALGTGDVELARMVFDEMKEYLSRKHNVAFFRAPEKAGKASLLQEGVSSGNVDLARFVFGEVRKRTSNDQFKEYLTYHSASGWNLFHAATQFNKSKRLPDPMMTEMLMEVFYKAFGTDKKTGAKPVITKLYAETRKSEFSDTHSEQPTWLKQLLSPGDIKEDRLKEAIKRTRQRVLRNIKTCLALTALHDPAYYKASKTHRLISVEDLGHCAGIPHLEDAIVGLFKNEKQILEMLEGDKLTRDDLMNTGWFKKLRQQIGKYIVYSGEEVKTEEYHPFLKMDGRSHDEIFAICLGALIAKEMSRIRHPAKTKHAPHLIA